VVNALRLAERAQHDPLVREHVQWALSRHAAGAVQSPSSISEV
jgi:hypothetical protein